MSKVNQALKDVLPTFSGDFPPPLLSYIDSLYSLSFQKLPILPHKADVARYHLCAFLAVQKYQKKFNLPMPDLQKVPIQPKYLAKLLADISDKVISSMTPSASPTKPKKLVHDLSPTKQPHTPTKGSPLRTLQGTPDLSAKPPKFAVDSPFNPGGNTTIASPDEALFQTPTGKKRVDFDEVSPFNPAGGDYASSKPSPFNVAPKEAAKSSRAPKKARIARVAESSSAYVPRYNRHLNLAEFISFANDFHIPASVTPSLLEAFMLEKPKFSKRSEWLLACGLVHAAYVRINHRLLQHKLGAKGEVQNHLFQYQKGNLTKPNMVEWIMKIEEAVKAQPWAVDLQMKYVHNDWTQDDTTKEKELEAKLGTGWALVQDMGSMKNPCFMFDKHSQVEYYSVWARRVREAVKGMEPKPEKEGRDGNEQREAVRVEEGRIEPKIEAA